MFFTSRSRPFCNGSVRVADIVKHQIALYNGYTVQLEPTALIFSSCFCKVPLLSGHLFMRPECMHLQFQLQPLIRFACLALHDSRTHTMELFFVQFRLFRNLIDIPSTFQVERLQQQEAQNRSNEYLNALNTVKLPEQTIRKLYSMTSVMASAGTDSQTNDVHETTTAAVPRERSSTSSGSSIKAPSVREVLAEKTVDPKTVGWVSACTHTRN